MILTETNWLIGWGREERRGLFMAFEIVAEQIVLFLIEDGQPTYLAPRSRHWPPALAESFAEFSAWFR